MYKQVVSGPAINAIPKKKKKKSERHPVWKAIYSWFLWNLVISVTYFFGCTLVLMHSCFDA